MSSLKSSYQIVLAVGALFYFLAWGQLFLGDLTKPRLCHD